VKIALLFVLLITHGCGVPASWAARHTNVRLDIKFTRESDDCMFLPVNFPTVWCARNNSRLAKEEIRS